MKKILAFAVMLSIAAGSISGFQYNCAYAENVEITCNVDGKSKVTNVGENADPLVKINFSEKVNVSSLNSDTIKIYKGDTPISYTPYKATSESYEIDLKNFSSLNKGVNTPQSYEPEMSEEYRIEISGIKTAEGNNDIDSENFSFSTSLVLPVSYIEGHTLKNVALGMEVDELGNGKADNADNAEYVTDGRQKNEWKVLRENVTAGNAAIKVDLGREYKIAGVAVAGVNGAWYDRYQVIGGSNDGAVTSMNDTTKFVTGTSSTVTWNQIIGSFYDYTDASKLRYAYVGSTSSCVGIRELYVWAYVPELVEETIPVNGAENASNVGDDAINNIEIRFFDEMDTDTLTPDYIQIEDSDGNPLTYGDYSADSYSYAIPITEFKQNKSYTVVITENVCKLGETSGKGYKFSFTTGAISMGSKPVDEMISSTYPNDGDEDITGEAEENIKIVFNCAMEESTLANIKIYDKENNEILYKNASYADNTYKIPISTLESDSEYSVKISDVVTEEGYESEGEYKFFFKTATVVGSMDISDLFAGSSLEDNDDAVTNVGESAYITVLFNKSIPLEVLKQAVKIYDSMGNSLSNINYSVSGKKCSLDKAALDSDSEYKLVISKENMKLDGMTITGDDIEIPFKTGYIFSGESKENTKIVNASKGKKVYSKNGASVDYIVDGDISNNYQIKDDTLLIDLGGYYEVLALKYSPTSAYDYSNGGNWWHISGIEFYLGNDKSFELDGFTELHTTTANEKPVIISNTTEAKYVRYIGIKNTSKNAVIGDIEIYARIGIGFGELSGKLSSNEIEISQTLLNYTEDYKKSVHMIFCQYDENGKLEKIDSQEVKLDEEKNEIKIKQGLNSTSKRVKVFVSEGINSFDIQTDILTVDR